MPFQITIKRVDPGFRSDSPLARATNSTKINQVIAGQDVIVDVANLTEAQLRGIVGYVRAAHLGLDTTSLESDVIGII